MLFACFETFDVFEAVPVLFISIMEAQGAILL